LFSFYEFLGDGGQLWADVLERGHPPQQREAALQQGWVWFPSF